MQLVQVAKANQELKFKTIILTWHILSILITLWSRHTSARRYLNGVFIHNWLRRIKPDNGKHDGLKASTYIKRKLRMKLAVAYLYRLYK